MLRAADLDPARPSPARPSWAAPLALFLLVAAAIGGAAAFSYLASAADLRADAGRELSTISLLKVRELVRWRDERVADADTVALHLAGEITEHRDVGSGLEALYAALRSHREYPAIAFLGPEGEVRFMSGAPLAEFADAEMLDLIRRTARGRRAVLTPMHRHRADPELHLNLLAPVTAADGTLLGAVVLRVDPRRQLLAMLQSWPRPSETAETLLVASEEGHAVVVNELSDGSGPMTVRVPLGKTDDVAALAASGTRGVLEARDHRGHAVLGAIAPVPDSAWTLVAKVDSREAFAPIRSLGFWTALLAAALVLAGGAGAALWWRTEVSGLERERAAADAERRLLARKLENLGQLANDAVFVADADLRIVDANDRATQMLGYAREELVGMPVRDLRDPATLGDFDSSVREQIERGARIVETRYRRKDGSTLPVSVSVHVDEFEGRQYFQAIARDMTARERGAEALRASEAKFRAAFEFASLGIIIVAPDGRIVETNRALRRMLGYGDDEMRGLRPVDIHEPGDDYARSILAQMVQGTRETTEMARRYRRKDGSVAETLLRASALRDDAGALQFALGVIEDVSEKKRLESHLVLADRLASVGTLAAGVAHEINNPLAFILSNLEFALSEVSEDAADPELRRALQDAKDGAVRVREIVRSLRAFSRPGDDQRAVLDPRRVLQSALGLAANEIRHRGELVVDLGDVPQVQASEHRLAQVFLNLVINAAHALPEGRERENRVRVATSTAPDGSAVIEVSDTGVGIPPDVLPRIFDPFFTTKPVGVGTGLGLSVCHGIVTQLGGHISVESAPGMGSTFRVVLPPAKDAARFTAGTAAVEKPAPAGAAPAASSRRGRVLVVDDEPLVSRALSRMLSPLHDVVARTSGQAALELLREDRAFDVVFCDLMMPGMTGMELHAALAATLPDVAARMVFLTGGAFTPAAREFLDGIANPYLEKPVDRGTLRDVVARAMAPAAPSAA
ncbi:MAG TPA: PAS domain S-box protein [Anaeromyxobacter sp.]